MSPKDLFSFSHTSVLLKEVVESFGEYGKSPSVVIDCTLGLGGHSRALLESYPCLKIIGIDQDPYAINYCHAHLGHFIENKRLLILQGRYSQIIPLIFKDGVTQYFSAPLVGILADIGVSSVQFDDKSRGFSFTSQSLDMRMNPNETLQAKEIVNTYPTDVLEQIFRDFGEMREYKKLAKLITQERKHSKFNSAEELSNLIVKHFKNTRVHPATQAFQALRIAVNDELGEISRLLEFLGNCGDLSHCLVQVISFHSLEDRIVKQCFKRWEKSCICPANVLKCVCGNTHKKGIIQTKKPIIPSIEETQQNPRARSAKMRSFYFNKER